MGRYKRNDRGYHYRYDWLSLKDEWIRRSIDENLSLNNFRIEKKIASIDPFYKHVRKDKWVEDREKIKSLAWNKLKERAVDETANRYLMQSKIYSVGEKQLSYWLQKNMKDGKIGRALDPKDVAAAMLAAYRALAGKRLIENKPTEIIEDRRLMVHALMQLQNEAQEAHPEVINASHTILGFDESSEKSFEDLK